MGIQVNWSYTPIHSLRKGPIIRPQVTDQIHKKWWLVSIADCFPRIQKELSRFAPWLKITLVINSVADGGEQMRLGRRRVTGRVRYIAIQTKKLGNALVKLCLYIAQQ